MPDLLSSFGHEPVRSEKDGNELWYISPFRYEKEPSFHTSYLGGKWIWNDFGRGDIKGSGTVIGFIELHENVGISEALQILKSLYPGKGMPVLESDFKRMPLFKELSTHLADLSKNDSSQKLIVDSVKHQIWDKGLIGYLAGERCINHRLALKYLQCIEYSNVQTGKTYKTLGFANDSGDFECRDKYFKGILKSPNVQGRHAAKDISYIPGSKKSEVAVFEGFMDFLSVLTVKNRPVLSVDVLILNMVNLRKRAVDFIKSQDYERVYTFFDNDNAGDKTTRLFEAELGEMVKSQNHLYTDFKDYNQWLQYSQKGQGQSRSI